MRGQAFVTEHRETWQRLAALLDRVEREGAQSLSPTELDDLGRAYLSTSAHLSQARGARLDPAVVAHLNRLLTRAYVAIYGPSRARADVPRFIAGIPEAFRRRATYVAVAVAISLLTGFLAYLATRSDPRWASAFVRGDAAEQWAAFARSAAVPGEYFADTARSTGGTELSLLLMSNNVRVAINAFALGATLGLGTLVVLTLNGLMIGAFMAVGANAGKGALFAAIVAPHGVLELSAIVIAGGAGLLIGHSLLDPGDLPRRDALRLAAADAARLLLGTVPMFVVAGIVEGTISPQIAGLFSDSLPRVLFGVAVAAALWLATFFGDRLRWRALRRETPAKAVPA